MTHTLYFHFKPRTPKGMENRRDEWGGVVKALLPDGTADVSFGARSRQRREGRIVTMQAKAGQLLYSGQITEKGSYVKLFGLAWRSQDGSLIFCKLEPHENPRTIFEAGGHIEPNNDSAEALFQLSKIDASSSPQEFGRLCVFTAAYMKAHLLEGSPDLGKQTQHEEISAQFLKALRNHSAAWPQYQDVLDAAAKKFREWDNLPLV